MITVGKKKKEEESVSPAPETTAEKWKALGAVEAALNKQFNSKTSIIRLGNKLGVVMDSVSTGLPSFDFNVAQIGGIPRPRITEIMGPEGSGKTTFALNLIAEEQRRGGICWFGDMEHALDPNYASALGVNINDLLVSQPDCGEEGLETVEALIKSQAISLAVIDSVASLVPRAELEGDMGDSHMGLQARLMSQACRKLRGICSMYNIPLIFINQLRANIGGYGNPEVTPGGRALKFYASLRLDIRKVSGEEGLIKKDGEIIGHRTRIKAIKNKVGIPFRETVVDLLYGVGYDKANDWIEYAVSLGVIKKEGAWYTTPDGERYQGIKNLKAEGLSPIKQNALIEACEKAKTENS